VDAAHHKLLVSFVDDERLTLAQGERRPMKLWISNTGTQPIKDVWMIAGPEDEVLLDTENVLDIGEKAYCGVQFHQLNVDIQAPQNPLKSCRPIILSRREGRVAYPSQVTH
jgi:hypothetical protein